MESNNPDLSKAQKVVLMSIVAILGTFAFLVLVLAAGLPRILLEIFGLVVVAAIIGLKKTTPKKTDASN